MARNTITTQAAPAALWNGLADSYEGYASRATHPDTIRMWSDKAAEAREKAQQYLSPAPSEAESPA